MLVHGLSPVHLSMHEAVTTKLVNLWQDGGILSYKKQAVPPLTAQPVYIKQDKRLSADEDLGNFVALTADDDLSRCGIVHAYTLKIEILNLTVIDRSADIFNT